MGELSRSRGANTIPNSTKNWELVNLRLINLHTFINYNIKCFDIVLRTLKKHFSELVQSCLLDPAWKLVVNFIELNHLTRMQTHVHACTHAHTRTKLNYANQILSHSSIARTKFFLRLKTSASIFSWPIWIKLLCSYSLFEYMCVYMSVCECVLCKWVCVMQWNVCICECMYVCVCVCVCVKVWVHAHVMWWNVWVLVWDWQY